MRRGPAAGGVRRRRDTTLRPGRRLTILPHRCARKTARRARVLGLVGRMATESTALRSGWLSDAPNVPTTWKAARARALAHTRVGGGGAIPATVGPAGLAVVPSGAQAPLRPPA